ncbi:hypothetical protein D3C81_2115750 [compost metagenome]
MHRMLGVDHGDDGVDQVFGSDFFIDEESLRDRTRIGEAGGFNHYMVELQFAGIAFLRQ